MVLNWEEGTKFLQFEVAPLKKNSFSISSILEKNCWKIFLRFFIIRFSSLDYFKKIKNWLKWLNAPYSDFIQGIRHLYGLVIVITILMTYGDKSNSTSSQVCFINDAWAWSTYCPVKVIFKKILFFLDKTKFYFFPNAVI